MDGKGLEKLLQDSCKIQRVDCTRLRDAGWQGESTQRRFTVRNICDFILFAKGSILYIEVKHSKDRLAISRLTQHKDMMAKDAQNMQNLFSGYLVHIDGGTWFILARAVDEFIVGAGKKSINKNDASRIGIPVHGFTPQRARKERLDIHALIGELKAQF